MECRCWSFDWNHTCRDQRLRELQTHRTWNASSAKERPLGLALSGPFGIIHGSPPPDRYFYKEIQHQPIHLSFFSGRLQGWHGFLLLMIKWINYRLLFFKKKPMDFSFAGNFEKWWIIYHIFLSSTALFISMPSAKLGNVPT